MSHETLEQAARDYSQNNVEVSDGLLDSLQGKYIDELFKTIKATSIAGASWREQQAASGYDEWWHYTKDGEDRPRHAWQAAHLSSAKLLAEKDAEIKTLKEHQVAYDEDIEGKFSDLYADIAKKDAIIKILSNERTHVSTLAHEKEMAEKDEEIQKAKELIKEMREALVFYGDRRSYSERIIHQDGAFLVRCTLDDDFDCIEPAQEPFFNPNLYGGKFARKTLKENAEKIKALLGEE